MDKRGRREEIKLGEEIRSNIVKLKPWKWNIPSCIIIIIIRAKRSERNFEGGFSGFTVERKLLFSGENQGCGEKRV